MKNIAVATTLLAATALAGCGTAGVILSPTGGDTESLVKAAENKAVVVSVPVSKIVIKSTEAKPPSTGGVTNDLTDVLARPNGQPGTHDHTTHHRRPPQPNLGSSDQSAPSAQNASAAGKADEGSTVVTQGIVISGVTYSISTIPEEDPLTTFRTTPINNFFSTNNLGVSKVANGDIPTSVSNDFTDQTQSRIAAVGSIVASAASAFGGLAAFARLPGTAPNAAQSMTAVCSTGPDNATIDGTLRNVTQSWTKLEGPSCWWFAFETTGHQVDTISRAEFRGLVNQGRNTKAWPVPSCLETKLLLKKSESSITGTATDTDADVVVPLEIADPATVRLVGIPDKGKIAMHPICDADVTDNPTDRWSTTFDSIAALETQAKAIAGAKQKSTR